MMFISIQLKSADNKSRRQLEQFVKANQQELAALAAWGL
jgi:hypothetical protein